MAFSSEMAQKPKVLDEKELLEAHKRSIPGSSAFVPATFGLVIASEVVKDLIQ